MLLFSDVLYMLLRYASPSGPMCLRYPMLTFQALWSFVMSVMLVVCSLSVSY